MKNGNYSLVKAPENYPGKKYRELYCSEHVLVYWLHYGVIPSCNEIIHHKDKNKFNNHIDNLQLMTKKEHNALHRRESLRDLVLFKCPVCSKEFARERSKTFLSKKTFSCCCCSRHCSGKTSSIDNNILQQRIKENVIKEFKGKAEDYADLA